jgi:5-methylcytosine-specific restriction enzyme subunit McrC
VIRIELTELGTGIEVTLTPEQGQLLARSGVITAAPSAFTPGIWLVSPAGKVGSARVGDIEVHIAPKLPIARLLFLAGYATSGSAWRDEDVEIAEATGLVPALAQALWRQVARAIHQGLLPGYLVTEETSPVLRGRLRESEQLHRQHGLPFPLEIVHDEFTTDIAENRILRTACERMLAVPRVDAESQRMLRWLFREFADVTPLHRADPVPAWQPTRLNARYHSALRLGELVLRATSAEHSPGGVTVTGFLFDMPLLFEQFVTVAMREELEATHGGRVAAQDRHFLDHAARVTLKPDIVWYRHGHPAAVTDAKYKADQPSGYPNADLYQMLAYCTALKLRRGHLIYARGAAEPTRHLVRQTGVEIITRALDLDTRPEALLGQVRDLASELASVMDAATSDARAVMRP